MDLPWILIGVVILFIIFIALFFVRKGKAKKLTPLASLSFVFVIAGIFSGDSRLISYSLMGIGIILAVIDLVLKSKEKGGKIR